MSGVADSVLSNLAVSALSAGRSRDLLVHLNALGLHLLQQRGQLAALIEVRTQSRILAKRVVHLRRAGS